MWRGHYYEYLSILKDNHKGHYIGDLLCPEISIFVEPTKRHLKDLKGISVRLFLGIISVMRVN